MTWKDMLIEAKKCFDEAKRISDRHPYSLSEAQAEQMRALAETGKGYLMLATELRTRNS